MGTYGHWIAMKVVKPEDAPRSKRKYPRFDFVKDVGVRVGRDLIFGRTENLCRDGAFVKVRARLHSASSVSLLLTVPGIAEICEVPCHVRWTDDRGGAGLQFQQLHSEVQAGILSLERTFGRKGPAR
jgi:hypothetical protein